MSSPSLWQRLNKLKPSLPYHVRIQPRQYGKEAWYVLEDTANGKFHRFNRLAYQLLGFMNGRNTLEQILQNASQSSLRQTLDDIPTQEDLVDLLQYLYVADLLICDFPPQTAHIFDRSQKRKQRFWHQIIKSPYAWRIPLLKPGNFLETIAPAFRWITSPLAGILWLATIIYALVLAASNWSQISATQLTSILAPENLLLLWLTYPLLKALHELGHGLFTTVWGGHVTEFGIVFILATPFPYVDATAATGFPSKSQRLMVSAAGMAVELLLAAIALIFWLHIEEGLLSNILFNIVLIGSVSTLFFNGNPLMRFDGYHILCDAADQPNLATRALLQLRYLIKRYGYGLHEQQSIAVTKKESVGLTLYGVAAFLYRLVVLTTIVLVVAQHFPSFGLFLAAWLLIFQLLLPLLKYAAYLASSKELQQGRARALTLSVASVALVSAAIFFIPTAHNTTAEGIVWLPEEARIRAESSGEVVYANIADGETVQAGDTLLHLSNIDTTAELLLQQATLKEYQSRYEQAWSLDRSQIQLFEQDIKSIKLEIAYLQERVNHLMVRSPSDGVFRMIGQHQLLGSFIREGDIIGLVLSKQRPKIRAVLKQEEVEYVRADTRNVWVRLSSNPGTKLAGTITTQVPAGTYALPSAALGTSAGGRIVVKSSDTDQLHTNEQVFLLDIDVPAVGNLQHFGEKVFVQFSHKPETLAEKITRTFQQTLVSILRSEAQ